MGYDIHIKRNPPLTLSAWKAAVQATDGVRLDSADITAVNPMTHETVVIPGSEGDARVWKDGAWLPCFRWRPSGRVTFRAGDGFDNAADPVRQIAIALANRLGAELIGDVGERIE